MKPINTRLHGILDYCVSLLLIAMPWILHYAESGYETWIPVAAGSLSILYSLFTRYEYSLVKLIPMRIHLLLDGLSAILLILTPYLLGYTNRFYQPQIFAGILELIVIGMSQSRRQTY